MKFTKKIREEYTEIIEFMESANVTINNDDSEIFEAWLQSEQGITITNNWDNINKADVIFEERDTADGYSIFARTDNQGNLYSGDFSQDIMTYDHNLCEFIAETCDELSYGSVIFVSELDWIEYLSEQHQFRDFQTEIMDNIEELRELYTAV